MLRYQLRSLDFKVHAARRWEGVQKIAFRSQAWKSRLCPKGFSNDPTTTGQRSISKSGLSYSASVLGKTLRVSFL